MGQQWYVRFLNCEAGPYSSGELLRFAADGALSPDSLVSLDRQRWIRAARVKGLFNRIPESSQCPKVAARPVDDLPRQEMTAAKGGIPSGFLGGAHVEAEGLGGISQAEKAGTTIDNIVGVPEDPDNDIRDCATSQEPAWLAANEIDKEKAALSGERAQGADAARQARGGAVSVELFWIIFILIRELALMITGPVRWVILLIAYSHGRTRTPILERRAREAQCSLGRRMFDKGIGDATLRAQIAVLNDRIISVGMVGGSVKLMELEMRGLMMRLANLALAEMPAPLGMRAEQRAAISAHRELETHRARLINAKTSLNPDSIYEKCRIALGFGVTMFSIAVLFDATASQLSKDNKLNGNGRFAGLPSENARAEAARVAKKSHHEETHIEATAESPPDIPPVDKPRGASQPFLNNPTFGDAGAAHAKAMLEDYIRRARELELIEKRRGMDRFLDRLNTCYTCGGAGNYRYVDDGGNLIVKPCPSCHGGPLF